MNHVPAPLRAGAWRWVAVLVWAGVIFWLSATPNLRVVSADDLDFVVRKAGHMCAFGILAVLLWRALAPRLPRAPLQPRGAAPWPLAPLPLRSAAVWALAWLLTVAYAATDEFHQSFTSGRHASPMDVGIDAAGASLFLAGLALFVAWRTARRPVGSAGRS